MSEPNKFNKYLDLYKNTRKFDGSQEERRQQLLVEQKRQREQTVDQSRGILKCIQNSLQRQHQYKKSTADPFYRNKLQLSEWLTERPSDVENWYLVPCPKGIRCLVVASSKRTTAYFKSGQILEKFRSNLEHHTMVLDCVFSKTSKEFYVLDCLAYGSQDFVNCEAEFRFFWLKSKFTEDNYLITDEFNKYPFRLIERYDFADEESVMKGFAKYPYWDENNPSLDGYLFYHKESSYIYGKTPLVGWLFAFMVPEILNVTTLHLLYWEERPPDYSNAQDYMKQFDESRKRKAKRDKLRRNIHMDVDEIDEDSPAAVILAEAELELGLNDDSIDDVIVKI